MLVWNTLFRRWIGSKNLQKLKMSSKTIFLCGLVTKLENLFVFGKTKLIGYSVQLQIFVFVVTTSWWNKHLVLRNSFSNYVHEKIILMKLS